MTADGPVYAAWLWRVPDGLEAAGQVRIDDTPELDLACAQLQPPGPQAVAHFKLEDSVSFWTPDPGPYRDAHDRPLAWRGWAPLLLVYADIDRGGRFTDEVDVALAANHGAGYDGVSWDRNVFYLPHAASTWRARAHLPHLRLFQSHPGSLFVHGQGRRIEWPTRFGVQAWVPARGFRRHPDAPDAGDPGDAGAGGGP